MKIYTFVCPECGQDHEKVIEEKKNVMVCTTINQLNFNEDDMIMPDEVEYEETFYADMPGRTETVYSCPVCRNQVAKTMDGMINVLKTYGKEKTV